MFRFSNLLAIAVFCAGATVPVWGQQSERAQEAAALPEGHWAGAYLGANIRIWIAPQAGFVFEPQGCMGTMATDDRTTVTCRTKPSRCRSVSTWASQP